MTTKDIKADYGAAGDGQRLSLTVSFSNGSHNLTVFSNTFNGGDVGKLIAVRDWIAVDGANPAGALLCTISSVGSFSAGSQTIVLDQAAQRSATSTSKFVEWGTDDIPKFTNFRNDFAGQTGVVLNIPAGRYCSGAHGGTRGLGEAIKGLTINGNNCILGDMLGAATGYQYGSTSSVFYNDNTSEVLIQTVAAGATTLHCVTVADALKLTVGTYAWMSGYDTQGFGFPPNPAFSEFVFITAVDTVAGTFTISSPLKFAYKSTWPKWVFGAAGSGPPGYTGGDISLGGPATLYIIRPEWDAVHVYNNVGLEATPTLANANGRDMTFNNCYAEGFAMNVSGQQNCRVDGLTGDAGAERSRAGS
jgi:hypothetical protein